MTVVTIVVSLACLLIGAAASYVLFKQGLKAKYDGILKDAEKPLTSGEVQSLLNTGMVKKTGLRSARTHTRYDATLRLDFNQDGRPVLRPTFD